MNKLNTTNYKKATMFDKSIKKFINIYIMPTQIKKANNRQLVWAYRHKSWRLILLNNRSSL